MLYFYPKWLVEVHAKLIAHQVPCYHLFVLLVQASAYKSGEVVQTLKKAFMPEGATGTTMTFQTEDDVLNYLGTKVRVGGAGNVHLMLADIGWKLSGSGFCSSGCLYFVQSLC